MRNLIKNTLLSAYSTLVSVCNDLLTCRRHLVTSKTKFMKKNKIISEKQKKLARYAKALSHPIRIYILEFLSTKNCCFSGELDKILPIARSTLSQHLKELKNAGLIQGNIEYPKIRYCINTENWNEVKKIFTVFFGS